MNAYETPILRANTVVGRVEVHSFDNSYRVDFFRNDRPAQAYRCAFVPTFTSAREIVEQYEVK